MAVGGRWLGDEGLGEVSRVRGEGGWESGWAVRARGRGGSGRFGGEGRILSFGEGLMRRLRQDRAQDRSRINLRGVGPNKDPCLPEVPPLVD